MNFSFDWNVVLTALIACSVLLGCNAPADPSAPKGEEREKVAMRVDTSQNVIPDYLADSVTYQPDTGSLTIKDLILMSEDTRISSLYGKHWIFPSKGLAQDFEGLLVKATHYVTESGGIQVPGDEEIELDVNGAAILWYVDRLGVLDARNRYAVKSLRFSGSIK